MIFIVALAITVSVMFWTWGMSKYRYVRIGSAIASVGLSVASVVYVLLPAIAIGLANPEPTEQTRLISTYDLVRPDQAVPTPTCLNGEKAAIKLMPAKIALRSGGGDWSTQSREGDWLVVFKPNGNDTPPLFAPLAMLTRNVDPIITAKVLCSFETKRV